MTIEIGSLVIRGSFGAPESNDRDAQMLAWQLEELRTSILDTVEDMLEERDRRARER
jgi:hypothetical protein